MSHINSLAYMSVESMIVEVLVSRVPQIQHATHIPSVASSLPGAKNRGVGGATGSPPT